MKFLNGTQILLNKRHGQRKMKYANGDIYEGNWKDDKLELTLIANKDE